MSSQPSKDETRAAYRHFLAIPTRWMDNDVYGHVNNVVYYSYFDTVVNKWLIDSGLLDFLRSETIGLVVETSCSYFRPIAFPDAIAAGLRVAHLGRSSVHYEVGLFRNDESTVAAAGHFIHVYVDRASNRPVAIAEAMRDALQALMVK
ncbi:acyl-CoA thioesterase [Hypericibacter sp.]|uniref:acyl-CoA thioesterase n=1 Tax=Hypericibacter sp. TaxID=2705401 RepID=UPI003D6DA596